MEETALLLGDDTGVRIPRVYREFCSRRVLVQERLAGATVADLERAGGLPADRQQLAEALLRSALDQVLRAGVFHADPHPGNVFILVDGSVGLIDFGAVGRLDALQQAAIGDVMRALVQRDVGLLRDAVERVADVAATSPRSARTPSPASSPITFGRRATSAQRSSRTSSPPSASSGSGSTANWSCWPGPSPLWTARCGCCARTSHWWRRRRR
jgi:RIO-like serine/threonine protein kinase